MLTVLFSQECASDITSCTPSSPRVFNELRNWVQKASFLVSRRRSRGPRGDSNRNNRLVHHPVVRPRFAGDRVEEDKREIQRCQIPVSELCDLLVQARADPRHLRLGGCELAPSAFARSSTFRVETPCKYPSIITANNA